MLGLARAGAVGDSQAVLENSDDDEAKTELAEVKSKHAMLADKVEEFNQMTAEQKAKADAALEMKKNISKP